MSHSYIQVIYYILTLKADINLLGETGAGSTDCLIGRSLLLIAVTGFEKSISDTGFGSIWKETYSALALK